MKTKAEIQKQIDELTANLEQIETGPINVADYGLGQECIIRTYSAGVFFGTPVAREGQDVVLKDARRIWSWSGAFTLSAVAQNGIKDGRLSCVEPTKLVLQVIEITPCSESAAKQFREAVTYDPND